MRNYRSWIDARRFYRSWRATVVIAVFGIVVGICRPSVAETIEPLPPNNSPLNEQVIRVRGEAEPPVTLEVTVLHPDGNGPFPLVIMNHGADAVSRWNHGPRYRLTNAAFYFLSRGYAVALPMMRGFSASGGDLYDFGCDFVATGLANARDIRAVIRYLARDPMFDASRVIVAGQSFGGWNTLAVGALDIPNAKGLINFNGGVKSSGCKDGGAGLVSAVGEFGRQTKIPSLWFYGDNDELFSVDTWRSMYLSYTQHGGRASIVDVGAFMKNSHTFLAFPESMPLWMPRLDAFLAKIDMPYAVVNPSYLPHPFPESTGAAEVTNINAVPYLNDAGRELYRKFLDRPFPRVFVIAEDGSAGSYAGGFDPLGQALRQCENRSHVCGVYAVDDRVVWKPIPSGSHDRAYSIAVKADEPTTISFAAQLDPDCRPKAYPRIHEIHAPAHGRLEISQRTGFTKFPSASPLVVCNSKPVSGIAVIYTPDKSYAGVDAFSFAEDRPNGAETTFNMSLTVR